MTATRFTGKTVIVTGAARGIGAAIAQGFAAEGAAVCVLDANRGGAEAMAASLGGDAWAEALDVSDEDAVAAAVAGVVRRRGVLDVVVNNAGIAGPQEPAHRTPLDGWNRTLQVNLTGPFLLSKHAVGALAAAHGCIVNIASALAFMAIPNACAYGPSKAGIVQLTRGMAVDYAPAVRVNCVCPGAVRTAMIESVLPPGAAIEEALAEYGRIHPLYRRLAQPEEIADAVLFLASADASLITGIALPVDGGLVMS
ncbi:MAG: SDR family oxidoreductase [Alphaproteobacteria bacterium]|nr:SDR family oxidoreductase [Alphaproteobacteria bacterium]